MFACRLETSLRSYSCLTTGDTIMVPYNNKKYYIDIVETKPSSAISIIETDCEVDFAPPLDYKEPEKPSSSRSNKRPPEGKYLSSVPKESKYLFSREELELDLNSNLSVLEEEPAEKIPKFSPFTGSARRLDGKPSTEMAASPSSSAPKSLQPNVANGTNGSKSVVTSSRQQSGKLVFGSNSKQPSSSETPKVNLSKSCYFSPTYNIISMN